MGSLPPLMPRLARASPMRIDRLAWTGGACFEAHGVRIGVRSNDPGVLAWLPTICPPGARPAPSCLVDEIFSVWVARDARPGSNRGAGLARIYAGRQRIARLSTLPSARAVLESAMRLRVAALSRQLVFVHAGAVAWGDRAILLPGRSQSGKTRLVAALVAAGAAYLSDEFAPLDGDGRVHPFPKPLTIRREGACDLDARRCSAEELGGRNACGPLPVGLVALAEFRDGASWRPARLSRGLGVLELLAHTVPARLRPEAALQALERALAEAGVLKGERGEAAETAARLLEALDRSARVGSALP